MLCCYQREEKYKAKQPSTLLVRTGDMIAAGSCSWARPVELHSGGVAFVNIGIVLIAIGRHLLCEIYRLTASSAQQKQLWLTQHQTQEA